MRIHDGFVRKAREEGFCQQHDEDVVCEDHRHGLIIAELFVETEAETAIEPTRAFNVLDGKVDVDRLSHRDPLVGHNS